MADAPAARTGRDVVEALMADHREVDALFAELEGGQGTPEHRRALADVVIAELVRHSVAEEAYVYPAARRALPDGDRIAEHEISEHADAERTMKELESMDPADPRFDQLLTQLTRTIRHHVQEEENNLFPRLRAACDPQELVDLAGKVESAKRTAPTRPHPAAPDRPPANRLLAPGTGLVDRLRDALSGRPTSREDLHARRS
ncbi:hemerythrin domain-containing protein [Micromonospora echinofusca]|uniref:Hemerythrin domain-containing protein n=1 Tax=Micromonospora echinofusca TaxID=47858 RepID=A0ABS3W0D5_MICEH|nr:hemerythrin domain-containing protein [Micromonospora echinofusca]MBO4210245.1 hemerythrin domain-containing protein [Micromonospora echinofusca]